MSNLPEIDQAEVSKRVINKTTDALTSKLLEAIVQTAQLEVLAEALRDERDHYKKLLDDAAAERESAE